VPQRQQGQQGQAQQQGQTQQQAPQQGQTQQAPQQDQTQQGQAQQGQTSGQTGASATGQAGSVNLTSQQRTTIQQTVLAGSNVPRVNNVNFALGVGTVVPTSVRVLDVVPALIEINPAWRGHQYFVVRDDIVIVDRSRKIVAVVPVGSSGGAQLQGGGGAAALNLSSDQIRQVQTVLKERGFNVVVDGRMDPRTVEAITAFQRQQGFQVSGRIDNQTISALGLSNMSGGAQGGATTGQGGAAAGGQGGASQQAPAQQNKVPVSSRRPAVRAAQTSSRHLHNKPKVPVNLRPVVRAARASSKHLRSRTKASQAVPTNSVLLLQLTSPAPAGLLFCAGAKFANVIGLNVARDPQWMATYAASATRRSHRQSQPLPASALDVSICSFSDLRPTSLNARAAVSFGPIRQTRELKKTTAGHRVPQGRLRASRSPSRRGHRNSRRGAALLHRTNSTSRKRADGQKTEDA
jgi:peptidoglycan hydrolase-like protein with peptidoglycan-binding domain